MQTPQFDLGMLLGTPDAMKNAVTDSMRDASPVS